MIRFVVGVVMAVGGFFLAWDSRRFYYSLISRVGEDLASVAGFCAFTTGLGGFAMGMILLGV